MAAGQIHWTIIRIFSPLQLTHIKNCRLTKPRNPYMCDLKKMFNFKNERNMKKETKRILEKARAGDAEAQYLTGLYLSLIHI